MKKDGSHILSNRTKKDGTNSILRYKVHKKLKYAVRVAPQYYTEEGNKRFAELFGEDGKKNMIKVEEVVEEKPEEKVEEKVGEKPVEKPEEKPEENDELKLENYDLSDLEDGVGDDDEEEECDAMSFDIETCEFVDYDTGYYKIQDQPNIFNAEGETIGAIVNGEYIGEYIEC